MRRSCCILVLLCIVGPLGAAEPQAADPAASASAVSRWVAELDSDQFDTRERAEQELIDAGAEALAAVAAAARNGSLESSTRAINILLAWAESEDNDLVIAALESLVGMKDYPKQAKAAEERLFYVREYLALKEFQELGGAYQVDLKTARNIMPIQRMQNLQVIIGSEWKGGVEGLNLLDDMPHVTTVSFHSTPLDDEALAILERLPQVRCVELFGTKRMTPAAIADLQQKLPGVTFDLRSGAFLGVQSGLGDHAEVGHVVKGSAADLAGIKKEDTIVKFEGQEIKDFRELTGLIAQYEPGDTVTLTVLRQPPNGLPEMIDLKVTFAQWGKNGAGELDNLPELRRALPGRAFEPTKVQLDRR